MITVACVLRSGGDYAPEHVWALQRGVDKHLQAPHVFRVLTDYEGFGAESIPLQAALPGWWSKLELFRPAAFSGRVLYFDLDTMLVGAIDDLAGYWGRFAMLEDFFKPGAGQSGVMVWTPCAETEAIWRGFSVDPVRNMRAFKNGGDGSFIDAYVDSAALLQRIFPGQIVSYKQCIFPSDVVPDGARVVCFHGYPRPWTTSLWEAAS